jgi:hypothetical protein
MLSSIQRFTINYLNQRMRRMICWIWLSHWRTRTSIFHSFPPIFPGRLTLSYDLPINRTYDFRWGSSPMSSMCLDGADTRSRLGCQVFLTKEVDGMVAKLPSATRNMYVDGESSPLSFINLVSLPSRSVPFWERTLKVGNLGTWGDGEIKNRLLMTRRQG